MRHALVLLSALALTGCANWDWGNAFRGAAMGYAAAGGGGYFYQPPMRANCTVNRIGNTSFINC